MKKKLRKIVSPVRFTDFAFHARTLVALNEAAWLRSLSAHTDIFIPS